MRVKPALGLLGATALWTAAMLATAPVEAAPVAPQPVVTVAHVFHDRTRWVGVGADGFGEYGYDRYGYPTAAQLDRYGNLPGEHGCATDTDCAQYAWDYGMGFDEMTPESYVWDRSKPYGWAKVANTAYVAPDAQLDPSRVEDWRTGTAAIGNATTYAADQVMFRTTDAVYRLDVVQASIGQPDGDA